MFESTSQFSFKCCINILCHQAKLSYIFFKSKIMYFIQKKPIKVQSFEIFECSGQNSSNSSCHFSKQKSVFLQMQHQYSVPSRKTLLYFFLAQRSCTLFKRSPLKCKFLRFSSAQVKIRRIPHVIFESKSQFSFKCCINIQCHQAKLLYTFFGSKIMYFNQKKPVKVQIFEIFECSGENSSNSSCHF